MAEQSIQLALDIADYANALETGRMMLEGSVSDLENNEQVQRIYLGAGAAEDAVATTPAA